MPVAPSMPTALPLELPSPLRGRAFRSNLLHFASLRKFRFNPLRGLVVSQSPLPCRKRGIKPLAALRLADCRRVRPLQGKQSRGQRPFRTEGKGENPLAGG
jgi:hypothetical protein